MQRSVTALLALIALTAVPTAGLDPADITLAPPDRLVRVVERTAQMSAGRLPAGRPSTVRPLDAMRVEATFYAHGASTTTAVLDTSTGEVTWQPLWAWSAGGLGVLGPASLGTASDPSNISMRDFSPVAPGYTWWYHDANSGESFRYVCHGQETVHGIQCWKTERTRPWPRSDLDFVEMGDQFVRLHRRITNTRPDRTQDLDLDPPVTFCDTRVVIGKVFTTEPRLTNPATGNTMVWTCKADRLETITVPAGTFPCLKLRFSIRDSGLGTRLADAEMWYGYKVGLVRRGGQFFGVFFYEVLDRHNLPVPAGARR